MLDASLKHSTPLARTLYGLLLIVMFVLIIGAVFLIGCGVMMLFPNGFREDLLTKAGSLPKDQFVSALALACFAGAAMAAAYIYVIHILRQVVRTLLAGDPFVPENISRLRVMWIVLAVSELFRMVMHSVSAIDIKMSGLTEDTDMINIRLGTWFLVFVIAALAEVFRHGAELRRDQELTV